MKTTGLVLVEPGTIELIEREVEIGPYDVLVETETAGICGTDRNFYLGFLPKMNGPGYQKDDSLVKFPYAIGHEGGGVVREIGSKVRRFKPGDHVMNFDLNATMAYFFVADEHDLELSPEGLDTESACLGEAIACAMYSGLHSNVNVGDVAVVYGVGFAGQIISQVMKRKGARTVVVVDVVDEKLALAKDLGADIGINATCDDPVAAILDITQGRGADVVAEVAGVADSINNSIRTVRHNGTLVFYSWVTQDVSINISRFHHDSLQVINTGLVHHTPEERHIWTPWALRPVVQGLVQVKPLINRRFPISEGAEAFRINSTEESVIKTVLVA